MFYSQCFLSSKGPLGAIWVAAYFYKKLKKSQVTQLDISSSVDQILEDELATYRVLAHLLIGVVRIYSKKVEYLFNDCNKVLLGIKDFMIRHKRNTTLMETVCAPYFSITLPKRFELDAFDLEIVDDNYEDNIGSLEEITLKDITSNTGEKHWSFEKDDMKDVATCWGSCPSSYTFNEEYDPCTSVLAFHLPDFDVEVGTSSNWENNHQAFSMAEEGPLDTSCNPEDNCQMFSKGEAGPPDTLKKSMQDCQIGEHSKVPQRIFHEIHIDDSCSQETSAIPNNMVNEKVINPVEFSLDYHQVDTAMLEDPILGEEGMEQVIREDWKRGDSKGRGHVIEEDNQIDLEARVQKLLDGHFLTIDTEMPCAVKDPHQAFDGHSPSDLARLQDDGISRTRGLELPCAVEKPQAFDGGHKRDDENLNCSDDTVSVTGKCQVVTEDNLAASVRVDDGISRTRGLEIPCAVEKPQAFDGGHKRDDENLNCSDDTVSVTGKCQVVTEDNLAASVRVDVNLRSQFLDMSGATTPDLLATPAAREHARVSRKRKCVFDDMIVFPNRVLKQRAENSCDLVCKRRDCPVKALATWKADRVSNILKSFLDPLIPCSSEIRSLFCMKKLTLPKSIETGELVDEVPLESPAAREKFDNSESPPTLGRSHERLLEMSKFPESSHVPMSIEIVEPPARLDMPGGSLEEPSIAPVTPIQSTTSLRANEIPKMPEISVAHDMTPEIQDVEKRQSFREDQQVDFSLVSEEEKSLDGRIQDQSGWSERTTVVMRCLERSYLEKKKWKEEEVVHLLQLLDRRTRKESAIFFYEILVLETKGYVHVTQEDAYGSILVRKRPRWGHQSLNEDSR